MIEKKRWAVPTSTVKNIRSQPFLHRLEVVSPAFKLLAEN